MLVLIGGYEFVWSYIVTHTVVTNMISTPRSENIDLFLPPKRDFS